MDIPATARLEVPTNNSGPQGLDHHVDIPATGSHEVPTNNSGPQGVGHLVDIPVTGSLEVTNNNSGPQDGNYANDCKLAAFGGLADCATAVAALMYKPPSSG
ncbi:uncharacterized protein LOC119308603 [Triticum dicoccoides]|uniref:uncharacterized protein LOC119308603 n=1 Tax=Triticum dicoccoides TaxID=85692 RepID=UPI00188F7EC2|nr:uncharacterized protein LOC119308603 [Triticum dicoccoides]